MNCSNHWFQRPLTRLYRFLVGRLTPSSAEKSNLEVERKFRLTAEEADELPRTLARLGLAAAGAVDMTDIFLPAEAEGDMVRIRVEREGSETRTLLTLKTWVTADGGKERKETEGAIGTPAKALLLALGRCVSGADLLSFSKHRRHFAGALDGDRVVVSIDDVSGLGDCSGLYLEVEMLVPVGGDVASARRRILSLVKDLFGYEKEQVMLSYMEMLKRSSGRARIS